jgi:tRNA threonylcarbamoyladenosine biosynthesis protein TsaB
VAVPLLALDSATSVSSAALCDDAGRILGYLRGDSRPDQADRLIELIDGVLREVGLDYGALDIIAVNHGPGSFTGIRAGVAAARALALAARQPVVAVNSLEVLAGVLGPQSAGTLVTALDARRGQVYMQIFNHELVALSEPQVLAPENVMVARLPPPIRLAGNGAALVRAALPDDLPTLQESVETDALGVARRAIARLAAGERPVPGHTVQPLYLRPPDARLSESPRVRAWAAT